MAYQSASDKAVIYLAARVLDEAWVSKHDDVAYYFKAPLAFLEAGRIEDASRVLDIAARYLEQGGIGSANGAYASEFPHYPWMWMCWAAVRLGRAKLAADCFDKLAAYMHPDTCSLLVQKPFQQNATFEADFFATAEVVKVALLLEKQQLAERAAGMLLQVLRANSENMKHGRFQLRWTGSSFEDPCLAQGDDVFHCVRQTEPGQLYFMLGFPMMVLLEISKVPSLGKSEEYVAAAMALLAFLKECTGMYESSWAHKVARAAAMVKDKETSTQIADFFLAAQQVAGNFQEDPEAMDSVDQTAELAVWLRQIELDLK